MPNPIDFNLIMLSAGFECGGNTTHRHFDSHPQLFTYPFESMLGTPQSANILTPAIPFRYAWPSFDSECTPEQAYQLMYDEETKTYLRTPGRSKFRECGMAMSEETRIDQFVDWWYDLTPVDNYSNALAIPIRPRYVEAYFRATFDAWTNFARTGRETHYLGYLPAIHMDCNKVFADFPTAKMVYVSRNPFSAYADTIKRPFPWSLTKYCQLWNVLQQHALICERKYPNRFFTVRYEDLVADPKATLDFLCECLGLEPFAQTPVPSFNRVPLPGGQIYPWGTIKQATTAANEATAAELTDAQRAAITQECCLMMREWGYLT